MKEGFYFGEFSVTKNQFAIYNETCHRVDFVEGKSFPHKDTKCDNTARIHGLLLEILSINFPKFNQT